jgi:ATP-binding protein involved in chromosome partitioning
MKDKAQSLIGDIKIPNSNDMLSDRIESLDCDKDSIFLSYQRKGVTPEDKKALEAEIIARLGEIYTPHQIKLMGMSSNFDEVRESHPEKNAPQSGGCGSSAQGGGAQQSQGPINNRKNVNGVKKVIAVSSAKGGVGKSTVAVNLAMTLKQMGLTVGLLDADIYGPSVPILLGKADEKPRVNEQKKIMPLEAHGLKFLSFGLFLENNNPVIWRGPMLGKVLDQFLFDTEWGKTDVLVVDMPPGTGDVQLSLSQNLEIDGVVIVSTPQEVALADTIKGFKMFDQVKVPVLGMVENMSYFICDGCDKKHHIFGENGVKKAAKDLGTDFLGEIPLLTGLRSATDSGTPYMSSNEHEGSEVWKSYRDITKTLLSTKTMSDLGEGNSQGDEKNDKGFFKRLWNK